MQEGYFESMQDGLKSCTRCKQYKLADLANFPPHNKTKSGFDSWCRKCRSSYRNEICRGKFRNVISDEELKDIKNTIKECIICGDSESRLVVDHDHKTGIIRGMLCNHCNRGIGHFRDDPVLMRFAATYVEQFTP
jgi:hypothetical protein